MFRATGAIDGVAYSLTWSDDEPHVEGSPRILVHLESAVGEEFMATPTGPLYVLDLSDGPSVFAALVASTIVTEASGDVPDITPPSERHLDPVTDVGA